MALEHNISAHVFFDYDKLGGVYRYADTRNVHASDIFDKIEERLLRLKYVTETCFNHQAWIMVDLETASFLAAARRLESVKRKVASLMAAYDYGKE